MRAQDLFMPVIVLMIVGMMVFPLPIPVLDLLLACNITLSILLLVGSVYLSEPERFTSLPTILLLSTLFRLGLNVSTTRQLLGQGEAPDVVVAFGNFVVGGNLVVGIVAFLIVTLVQFLVVAKGAERVAEVAARFTLDAMPGKQMAIDADIRAGILTVADAKQKRLELQRESRLYGALDGAMKFVKGDAIAGLVITALNISAGLILGIFQHGLSPADAAMKYSIFTIGDGLVSQIPALLTAVAAGIAVTRVSDHEDSSVGREMLRQLGNEPQALGATSGVLAVLACVPGLSFLTFGFLSAAFAGCAVVKKNREEAAAAAGRVTAFRPKLLPGIAVRFPEAAVAELQRGGSVPAEVQSLRARFFERYGIVAPDFPFDVSPERGTPTTILLHGVPIRRVECRDGESLSRALLIGLEEVLEKYRLELLDDTHTRTLMELHVGSAEDLINAVIPKLIPVTALTTLFRDLVRENVSIKNFPLILQAIAEFFARIDYTAHQANQRSPRSEWSRKALLAEIRIALKRSISASVSDAQGNVFAWVLEPATDHFFARAAMSDSPLLPEICERFEDELSKRIERSSEVLLCTRFARPLVSQLLEESESQIRVLAAEELTEDISLRVRGEIGIICEEFPEPRNAVSEATAAA